MTADSPAYLISLLAGQRPEEILGTPESEWVDFKSISPKGPYDLSTDKGKFELAKDVAAFANDGGGLIVCGIKATQRPTELYEAAAKLTPFARSLVNSTTYKDVITEYVRPLLKVNYLWFDHPADDPDTSGHYLVIEVSALPESDRWALITRGLTEDGRFVKGSWTVPIRNGDTTAYLSPDEAYRLLSDGLRARRVSAATASAPAPLADRAQTRAALRARMDLDDVSVLFFQSTPDHPKGLAPGMYATGGLRDILQNQDTLRGADAFNFSSVYHQPQAHEGGLILANSSRRGLCIESDGAVTAAVAANGDMLGWAMERYAGGKDRRISVFVLTELTLEYFRLVDQHVLPRVEGSWTHRIVATDFARPPARTLAAGDDPNFPHQGSPQPATSDDWNHTWGALGDPERDAYEALRHIYALFGLDATDNPFTEANRVSTTLLMTKQS